MAPITVDPQTYFAAGKKCAEVGAHITAATATLVGKLADTGAMAGSYPSSQPWAKQYDHNAVTLTDTAHKLADALTYFGELLGQAGYNYALANYHANISPNKGPAPAAPPAPQRPIDLCWAGPASAGGPGEGLVTNIPGLLSKIGVPVPDGDTTKLGKAAKAWSDFAADPDVAGAADALLSVAGSFMDVSAPEIPELERCLAALRKTTASLTDGAAKIAQDCHDHEQALDQVRHNVHHLVKELAIALGTTVVVSVVGMCLTAGFSSIAGGSAATGEIAATGTAIAEAIEGSALITRVLPAGAKDAEDLAAIGKDLDEIVNLPKLEGLEAEEGAATESASVDLAKLDDADREALKDYTGSGYYNINKALREGTVDGPMQARIDAINRALSKLPDHEGRVFRNTTLSPEQLAKYEPGKSVVEPAFTSTANGSSRFAGNVEFRILSSTGKDISAFSHYPSEQEIIFRSGTEFAVKSKIYNPETGKTVIEMMEK